MLRTDPLVDPPRRPIRPLAPEAVDRIAAGEVVERPASAVKELVENALDAGARRIEVALSDGGRRLIRVADDGCGIPAEELPLALARHATSKTDGRDLLDLRHLGFRGEALASIASVSRLSLTSRVSGQEGARIVAEAGRVGPVVPAAIERGTVAEVRDLFFAVPARLHFLRGIQAERRATLDALRRLALSAPAVAFVLRELGDEGERLLLRLDAESGDDAAARRIAAVLGQRFAAGCIPVEAERDGFRISGLAALPAEARGAGMAQFVIVNGRAVRDRLLLGALRAGYGDLLPAGRHPAAVLFVDCDPRRVDVNVHPAKAEVRFREPDLARAAVVSALRRALGGPLRPGPGLAQAALNRLARSPATGTAPAPADSLPPPREGTSGPVQADVSPALTGFAETAPPAGRRWEGGGTPPAHPLGAARAQIGANWIIAETPDGLVLVDAHAAHERILLERLRKAARSGQVPSQPLLVPVVAELSPEEAERLLDAAPALLALGVEIEPFGGEAVLLRALPAALAGTDGTRLLRLLAGALAEAGQVREALERQLDAILARVACHASVRTGRRLRLEEMDALLREMERTPGAGSCNHGRPTFVALSLREIEALFGRR
ncbi:DNA mismatch repair endonuclease MutL [Rubellimicrobium sp. CFH 75288]|uniref:DNA mismatch repair endonuclease MutL n=1 Tax=Rubellimicrobium sp. CFH 75288 TaxID=2697034 RepID=UPI001412FF0F|nr:DNA mismatch repair endonuclease MutL [Rubellimicrobium sp. CFH 75288]NAZ37235.1 DNA mismatch repair endonuclease MutL [Rubellimicrobium sp. CFH 75288]